MVTVAWLLTRLMVDKNGLIFSTWNTMTAWLFILTAGQPHRTSIFMSLTIILLKEIGLSRAYLDQEITCL